MVQKCMLFKLEKEDRDENIFFYLLKNIYKEMFFSKPE